MCGKGITSGRWSWGLTKRSELILDNISMNGESMDFCTVGSQSLYISQPALVKTRTSLIEIHSSLEESEAKVLQSTGLVRLKHGNKPWHLHQCSRSLQTHDSDRLPFSPPRQTVEGRAGAGKGAEGGGAGGDGSLRYTEAVNLFHHAEGTTPSQGVYNLRTQTHTQTNKHTHRQTHKHKNCS